MSDNAFRLLKPEITHQLELEGIEEPSEIQNLAIPAILKGLNTLLIAPTGTGKTLAAVLPVLDLYLSARLGGEGKGISVLYVTPLRALNRDLLRRLTGIAKSLIINLQVRHGDTATRVRVMQAKSPPEILITTPETLQAILPGKRMREHLRSVRWVVIDEIHELAMDKRGIQLSLALERLARITQRELQKIGLSATVGDEEKVARFLVGEGRNVTILKSGDPREPQLVVEYIVPTGDDHKEAARLGIPPAAVGRINRIRELLREHRSSLVFTNTREHAESLGARIHALDERLPVRVHHGSLSKEIREEVEREFESGSLKGVICTSSLELGIDVGAVDFIVQYMSPRQATRLIQRVGRSEHRLRGMPRGTIIATWADDILESSVIARFTREEDLEPVKIHENALDVLAHQIVGMALDEGRVSSEDLFKTVRRSYAYRNLTPEDLMSVINQLRVERLIDFRDGVVRPKYPRAFRYYYENLSMIPSVKRYDVFDFIGRKKIGMLDQEFVARRCKSGTEFIMHGHTWKILSVKENELTVEVEPTNPSLDAIPSWEGEMIPVDVKIAMQVGALRRKIAGEVNNPNGLDLIAANMQVSGLAITKISETIAKHTRDYPLPTDSNVVVESFENCVVVHVCYGSLVNETLAMALSSILSARYGAYVSTQTDPYRIALICAFKMNPQLVSKEIKNLTPHQLERVIDETIVRTHLFAWRIWHVARRFGAVEKKAEYSSQRGRILSEIFRETPIGREAKREILAEKLDLDNAKLLAAQISEGRVSIVAVEQKGTVCSPLALPTVDKIVPHDLLRPAIPSESLVQLIKERLHSDNVRLVCMFNADWEGIRTVGNLPDKIRCPVCRSSLIATTYENDDALIHIAKKKIRRQLLTQDEGEIWRRSWKSASLVQSSGKKAVIAMSGRGVGPTVASRVLRRYVRSEGDFYMEILKAEREYARTRIFWD